MNDDDREFLWGVAMPGHDPWDVAGVEWKESEEKARSAAIATARANPGVTVTLVRKVAEVRCPVGEATWEQASPHSRNCPLRSFAYEVGGGTVADCTCGAIA